VHSRHRPQESSVPVLAWIRNPNLKTLPMTGHEAKKHGLELPNYQCVVNMIDAVRSAGALRSRADVNAQNSSGSTVLILASHTDDPTRSIGSPPVKLLVSIGLFLPSRTIGTWKAVGGLVLLVGSSIEVSGSSFTPFAVH
jgi:hypothetical protein